MLVKILTEFKTSSEGPGLMFIGCVRERSECLIPNAIRKIFLNIVMMVIGRGSLLRIKSID